jgi:hypothetical protein
MDATSGAGTAYPSGAHKGSGGHLRPPVGPGQSPGRGTRGALPPGSSWIVEILRLKFLPEKKDILQYLLQFCV